MSKTNKMKPNLNTSMKRNLADWSKLKYVE